MCCISETTTISLVEKCNWNYICAEGVLNHNCMAQDVIGESVLVIKPAEHTKPCAHHTRFGGGDFCTCENRVQIYLEVGI